MRVLIADDSPADVCILSVILQDLRPGLEIQTAADGGETLFALGQVGHPLRSDDEDPDLVLLDLHMPGVSGLQVLEQLQGVRCPPLVALTTSVIEQASGRAEALGAQACYVKPANLPGMEALLTRIVNRWLPVPG